jgi:hypothetical protein
VCTDICKYIVLKVSGAIDSVWGARDLALAGPFLAEFRDPVLWKCCHGSYDHFMFWVNKWIRPAL